MNIKKFFIGVIIVLIVLIIFYLIMLKENSMNNYSYIATVKNNNISSNCILKEATSVLNVIEKSETEVELLTDNIIVNTIDENDSKKSVVKKNTKEVKKVEEKVEQENKKDTTNKSINKEQKDNANIVKTQPVSAEVNINIKEKEEISSVENIIKEESIIVTENSEENTKIDENITFETLDNNKQDESNIKNDSNIIESEVINEDKKEESTSIVSNLENNKIVAKQKMLNSINNPIEFLYRKNGEIELNFNKAEALKVASSIIEESFKYDKLWNGEKFLYKIEFKYIESIMQHSMYWPFRESAIISATKNKNTNGTFYIWAEDYIDNGNKIHTQYCIR